MSEEVPGRVNCIVNYTNSDISSIVVRRICIWNYEKRRILRYPGLTTQPEGEKCQHLEMVSVTLTNPYTLVYRYTHKHRDVAHG